MKYIGMDVHKSSITVSWVDEENHQMQPFCIPNTTEQVLQLAQAIERPCRVAIEATRNHAYIHDLLEREGLDVLVSHPKATEAIASSKKKSDRHDALILSRLLKADLLTESYVPPLDIRLLREMVREYRRLISITTRARNWVRATLAQEGLTCAFANIFGQGAQAWLAGADINPIRKKSVERCLELISYLQLQIKEIKEEIVATVSGDPDVRLLTSIPGIGNLLAAAIKAEIGEIARFKTDKQLASYAGLVTTTKESAGIVKHGHITKEGSATLRWALEMAVFHLKKKPGPLKNFYERLVEKHGKKSARTAAARKLATYIYAILTERKEYDPETAVRRSIQCALGQMPVCVG